MHVMKMCQAFARNGHAVQLIGLADGRAQEPGVGDLHAFYSVNKTFDIRLVPP
jgi:hypothetical protein